MDSFSAENNKVILDFIKGLPHGKIGTFDFLMNKSEQEMTELNFLFDVCSIIEHLGYWTESYSNNRFFKFQIGQINSEEPFIVVKHDYVADKRKVIYNAVIQFIKRKL